MFYKETNFKETPIGKIPQEWNVTNLESIAKISSGNTAPQDEKYFRNGKYPFIRVQHLTELQEQKYPVNYDYINDYAVSDLKLKKFKKGSIIFPKSGESIKLEKRAILKEDSYVVNHLAVIEPFDKNNIDNLFLFHYLCTVKTSNYLTKTTMPSLNLSTISNFLVPLPSLSEQQKIAEVLSTVDEAIQKTNEIIAKTERLKKGLMQELLTKGVGHKEFKDTEIGRIPREWEVVKLEDVVSEAKPGFACGKRDENGILQLRMDNIEPEGWINVEAGVRVPVPEDVEDYILKPGNILFNNTNSIDLIGKTAIFRGEFSRCVYSNHLTRIRVNQNKVIPEWVLYLLIRKWELGVFKAICHRHVHQAGINNEDLLRLKIPLPSLQEQQKITSIILTVDNKIKLEKKEKVRLERIKQGLMDLLLTGKIRVKVRPWKRM
jgi:type I restriction enzyme S subunit